MFYCREEELKTMNQRYNKDNFEFIVMYGRRRVGKTSLINEFCKDKRTVYFSALSASAQENLEALSKAVYSCQNPDSTSDVCFRNFDDALNEITEMAVNERLVFVIDEYPYLAKADKSISSRLQHIIDHKWQNTQLFLILCGSSMSFMENQVLGYESPLYGRRTAQFKIQALTYKEMTVFHPELSAEDQALMYGITGGIPHYINKLEVESDPDEALLEHLFNTSGYLFEEPENLMKQELREPAIYNSVVSAIAGGASRANEIATKVGLESGVCAKYLKVLLSLGIIKKETPITEKQGKHTIYVIDDNFFRFWYRFVPQNMSIISAGKMRSVYDKLVKQHLSDYMGLVFEKMCRTYLFNYAKDLPITLTDIGSWWGSDAETKKEVQIDIVGTAIEEDKYLIGSCKYRNEKVGVAEFELLKRYAQVFNKNGTFYYYIFSKSGFKQELRELENRGEVVLLTLEDIYKD